MGDQRRRSGLDGMAKLVLLTAALAGVLLLFGLLWAGWVLKSNWPPHKAISRLQSEVAETNAENAKLRDRVGLLQRLKAAQEAQIAAMTEAVGGGYASAQSKLTQLEAEYKAIIAEAVAAHDTQTADMAGKLLKSATQTRQTVERLAAKSSAADANDRKK